LTNRVQTQRSTVTGSRPTGRAPGELYSNWADLQLGVVDESGKPDDLIAIRFFSAQANYVPGDLVVQAGVVYQALVAITAGSFNPAQWAKILPPTFYMEALPVTVLNTLPNLTNAPNGALIMLAVNGAVFMPVGPSPPFSVSGKTITWLSTSVTITPGATVAVSYTY
jgi:hypothetical protein